MKRLNQIHQKLSLCVFASMVMASGPAMAEINLPSAVQLDKSIYFQKPDGEPVQLKPGIYEVAQNGEKQLNLDPLGDEGPIAVQAIAAGHEEALEAATAKFVPSPDKNADKEHLVLWLPDGLALEAVGSYSGVFTRGTEMWAKEAGKSDAEAPLTVDFENPIYFKTPGGDPKVIQPGEYQVALLENGLQLSPADGKGEPIAVETESTPTSAAVVLPDFDDNPNLELLMVSTATGASILALGSHDGTFPRGVWGSLKGAAKKVGGAAKGAVKKAAGGVRKAAVTVGRTGYKVGKNYVVKYGKKVAVQAYYRGKGLVKKACGIAGKGAAGCLKLVGTAAAAAS